MFYSAILLSLSFLIINGVFAYQTKNIDPSFWSTIKFQLMVIPIFFIGNVLAGLGFKYGYKFLGNNTLVVASSKIVDVLALLIISYFFFHEVPSLKTILGLVLIIVGIIVVKL